MASEIFLITDPKTDAERTAAALEAALGRTAAAALLIAAGGEDDAAYLARVERLGGIARAHDCAVLLDNRPDLVRAAGADGVHMSGGIKALGEAIADLKPDHIVGTGDIGSRHEAMLRGEMEIDYLMFGDRDEPDGGGRDMAQWWAETFEVPSVYLASDENDTAPGTEFLAFAEADWARIRGARP